jgi:predicted DNA-binding transcriptional regulator AlpA
MNEYAFSLNFHLAGPKTDPEDLLDALYDAGCDDALVGTGIHGTIGLDFQRVASSAGRAIESAANDVKKAVPNAELIEISPDYIGVSEIAELLGCTRQNARKLVTNGTFPRAMHLSGHASIWRLIDVVDWAMENGRPLTEPNVEHFRELAAVAAAMNAERQFGRYGCVPRATGGRRRIRRQTAGGH